MAETVVSSKYQVVIPKAIRERAHLRPGERLMVVLRGRVISLVPEQECEDLFGAFPQLGTFDMREKEDKP